MNQCPVSLVIFCIKDRQILNTLNELNLFYSPGSFFLFPSLQKKIQDPIDYIALDNKKGQRAMLIKGNKGDFGVLIGHWTNYRKAGKSKCSGVRTTVNTPDSAVSIKSFGTRQMLDLKTVWNKLRRIFNLNISDICKFVC